VQSSPTSPTLRAASSEDDSLMLAVYCSTRADEMALVDWTDEQKQSFLQMQFDAQRISYLRDYPNAEYFVILNDGVEAGRLIVDRSGEALLIVDIAILPEHRNFGIGKSLIADLQDEARKSKKSLRLHVENFNRAQRLYERLGFQKVAEVSFYWRMEWNPAAADMAQVA
jgi:ribosomal protein S18 acetylase RimI-like enzyme